MGSLGPEVDDVFGSCLVQGKELCAQLPAYLSEAIEETFLWRRWCGFGADECWVVVPAHSNGLVFNHVFVDEFADLWGMLANSHSEEVGTCLLVGQVTGSTQAGTLARQSLLLQLVR